jgi:hypothetical protein
VSRQIRSRRAGIPAEEIRHRPLYARALGLQYLDPSGLLCFLFFEGTIALAVLLALAELVSWWGVLVLPVSVAIMVKINDVVAGAVARSAARVPARARAELRRGDHEGGPVIGRASVRSAAAPSDPLRPAAPPLNVHPAEQVDHRVGRQRTDHGEAPDSPRQRARQSGTNRYE